MLTSLRLRDFVIVEHLELQFAGGFTVLTGETGAGKSILIDALGLALGARAETQVVREGAPRTEIAAEFSLPPSLEAWLHEKGLEGDPGQLHLRRLIDREGRSRALVNDHPATLVTLREIAAHVLDIHGQHASQALLRHEGQRALLDRVAQLEPQVQALGARFQAWRSLERALEAARQAEHEAALERERLTWQLDQLRALAPEPGEWESLHAEKKRLAHAAQLSAGGRALNHGLLESDEAIVPRLQSMQHRLRGLLALDPSLAPIMELLEGAAIQAAEAAAELSAYADRVELEPQRLERIEARLSELFAAGRKWRLAPEHLAEALTELEGTLAALPRAEDLERQAEATAQAQAAYLAEASALTQARTAAAATLSKHVSSAIAALGMHGGHLSIAITPTDPGPSGVDRIEFLIAGHAGVTARPLNKVASGGELSRVSLAISALAAEANPVATLIFDEADAGVGGAVAEVIGALMRDLGQTRQVLCVTHLPQVAAQAHHHFRVSKTQSESRTLSRIQALDPDQRIEEIARMLGGRAMTATTREHAREMLANSATRGDTGPLRAPGADAPTEADAARPAPRRGRGA